MYYDKARKLIEDEYFKATNKFGEFASAHEGLAIVQEEFEELKAEVFKGCETRDIELMKKEARQLGAMALRFLVDIC